VQVTTLTHDDGQLSMFLDGAPITGETAELWHRYRGVQEATSLSWTEQRRLLRRLGAGGQGIVFLAERLGADGFRLPVALKVFSPEPYPHMNEYAESMGRMSRVAARVALIQQDNLVDVHNFAEVDGLRALEMEWVDGFDLGCLMNVSMLDQIRGRIGISRWDYLNDVVVTAGPEQARLKPGIAIAVLRDLLAALAALHREGIVHGDVKPSNVMLKRTGNAKLIDIGSAFDPEDPPSKRSCTPYYAAPEVLAGSEATTRSDLASLGYVLIELLSGTRAFRGPASSPGHLEAKRSIAEQLHELLPAEVLCNEILMGLISGLVAPDPDERFPDAEAADLVEQGAANFQRQLVKGDLASEYASEIRTWLEALD
jgi:eukaryotic-like serine/threonine-protein kinase